MASETADGGPGGYLSEEGRRRFCIVTGLLGGGAFIAQFALPMVLMFVTMPAMVFGGLRSLQLLDVRQAVGWQGGVWTVKQTLRPQDTDMVALVHFRPDQPGEATEEAEVHGDGLHLLPAGDRLWLIWPDRLAFYRDGEITWLPVPDGLGEMTQPIMHEGEPTVATLMPSAVVLRHLRDGVWQYGEELRLDITHDLYPLDEKLQLVSAGGVLHLFVEAGKTVYHEQGIPADEAGGDVAWRPVASNVSAWRALAVGGRPTVVCQTESRAGFRLAGWELADDGHWRRFLQRPAGLTMELGACTLPDPDRLLVLLQGFPGQLRTLDVRQGAVAGERRLGTAFPFGSGMLALMAMPYVANLLLPLVLAVVLTVLMAMYRAPAYTAEGRTVMRASLIRRGLAEVVDAAIAGGPLMFGFASMTAMFSGIEEGTFRPESMLTHMGLLLLSLLWGLICFVVFSITEGTSGRTPGKLLLGIRVVGTDLKLCGIGRALVRNLLKVVDGFFYWLVGVLLVALTDNWQRLGDMAARTIVVRASGNPAPENGDSAPVDPRFRT